MSQPLARIRVRESYGIRRFLYPLSTVVDLPVHTRTLPALGFAAPDGAPAPSQVTSLPDGRFRVDFAVSLAPLSVEELHLKAGAPSDFLVDDPLHVHVGADGRLGSAQQRFALALDPDGLPESVVYDGVHHLRAPLRVQRNGAAAAFSDRSPEGGALSGGTTASGSYPDGCALTQQARITACKSWVTVSQVLRQPKTGDELVFTLPLAVTTLPLTCDFGVGGGVYGKLQPGGPEEIVWRTEFSREGGIRWSVETAGRVDHRGQVARREEWTAQRWFHLIDRDKALAVAITRIPAVCRQMTVTLTAGGDVTAAFQLGETQGDPAEFGLCFHFLNAIPPLAAATNPQSILLPPIVEAAPAGR